MKVTKPITSYCLLAAIVLGQVSAPSAYAHEAFVDPNAASVVPTVSYDAQQDPVSDSSSWTADADWLADTHPLFQPENVINSKVERLSEEDSSQTEQSEVRDSPEYSFEEALEHLTPDYAAAVIVKSLTEKNLKELVELEIEAGLAVIGGKIVLFTSGNKDEIRILPAARKLLTQASLIAHTHPASQQNGPSFDDLNQAGDQIEYLVSQAGVYAYNRNGLHQPGPHPCEFLIQKIEEQHDPESSSKETRDLLHEFIQAIDEYNSKPEAARLFRSGDAVRVFDFTSPFYRLAHPGTGDHFYTLSAAERDQAVALGYVFEGIAGYLSDTPEDGLSPFYRLANPVTGDHFYTISAAERDNAISTFGYIFEGIAGYLRSKDLGDDTAPLFRLANPVSGDHFYTMSAVERDNAVASFGYVSEGIAGYMSVDPREIVLISPSMLTTADLVPLPANATLLAIETTVNTTEITSTLRGLRIQFDTRTGHRAGGGFTFDDTQTPVIETEDLSALSEFVFGLIGDVSRVRFKVIDGQNRKASVLLTKISSQKEQVWKIPVALLEGVDLTQVRSLFFIIEGSGKTGSLEVNERPLDRFQRPIDGFERPISRTPREPPPLPEGFTRTASNPNYGYIEKPHPHAQGTVYEIHDLRISEIVTIVPKDMTLTVVGGGTTQIIGLPDVSPDGAYLIAGQWNSAPFARPGEPTQYIAIVDLINPEGTPPFLVPFLLALQPPGANQENRALNIEFVTGSSRLVQVTYPSGDIEIYNIETRERVELRTAQVLNLFQRPISRSTRTITIEEGWGAGHLNVIGDFYQITTAGGLILGPADEISKIAVQTPAGWPVPAYDYTLLSPNRFINVSPYGTEFVTLRNGERVTLTFTRSLRFRVGDLQSEDVLPDFLAINGTFVPLTVVSKGANPIGWPLYEISFDASGLKGDGTDVLDVRSIYGDKILITRHYISHDAQKWIRFGTGGANGDSDSITLETPSGFKAIETGLAPNVAILSAKYSPGGKKFIIQTQDGRTVILDLETEERTVFPSAVYDAVKNFYGNEFGADTEIKKIEEVKRADGSDEIRVAVDLKNDLGSGTTKSQQLVFREKAGQLLLVKVVDFNAAGIRYVRSVFEYTAEGGVFTLKKITRKSILGIILSTVRYVADPVAPYYEIKTVLGKKKRIDDLSISWFDLLREAALLEGF